jgi:hypothetical protein
MAVSVTREAYRILRSKSRPRIPLQYPISSKISQHYYDILRTHPTFNGGTAVSVYQTKRRQFEILPLARTHRYAGYTGIADNILYRWLGAFW